MNRVCYNALQKQARKKSRFKRYVETRAAFSNLTTTASSFIVYTMTKSDKEESPCSGVSQNNRFAAR